MAKATWIVVADAARARIYATDHELAGWASVRDLVHPESRVAPGDLVSDTQGPQARRGPRSGPTFPVDAHDQERERFAGELAGALHDALVQGEYDDLVLVAPPQMMGWLRARMDKGVADRVKVEITKDYSRQPAHEVRSHVRDELARQPLLG